MAFVLQSILSDMNIATPAFFHFHLLRNTFLHPFTFNLCESFIVRWVSCKEHRYESCFFIQSASLCLFFFFFILFQGHFCIYLQVEWEGEGEKERERNIDVRETHGVVATYTTPTGIRDKLQPKYVPLADTKLGCLWSMCWCSNH
uniref:Uncharacterized protein n=1 Tax=Molossus molossus TaxID=27622 RepID=A0A7J8B7Z5_MOLMO|nr:hypothetical protein HJG59_010731 [Molossus molossus]